MTTRMREGVGGVERSRKKKERENEREGGGERERTRSLWSRRCFFGINVERLRFCIGSRHFICGRNEDGLEEYSIRCDYGELRSV